jgi:lipoate-protein ligase B
MPSRPEIGLLELGTIPYGQALALQHRLRSRLIDGDSPEDVAGWLLVLEHPPVVTLGKRGSVEDLAQPRLLRNHGIECFQIDRGGEATAHEPGQLVVYPVVDLETLDIGVVDIVRGLAAELSEALGTFGIDAAYDADHPGIWTQGEPRHKLASVGMRVRRGITTHGAALNLVNDLSTFSMIVPCGMPEAPMARLADLVDSDEASLQPLPFARSIYEGLEALLGADLQEAEVELPHSDDWAEPIHF